MKRYFFSRLYFKIVD